MSYEDRMANKVEMHKTICLKLNDTYRRKNQDYGDSFANVRKEIPNAILVRLMDKLERLKTLYNRKDEALVDESIEDTLIDLANYCLLELVECRMEEQYMMTKKREEIIARLKETDDPVEIEVLYRMLKMEEKGEEIVGEKKEQN